MERSGGWHDGGPLLKFKDSESEAADFFHSQFKTEKLKAD